jgi:hypothetical protein
LACELECDDLGAASLGASDEMQDAQPRHAAMTTAAGPDCSTAALVGISGPIVSERCPALATICRHAGRACARSEQPGSDHVDGALWQPHIEPQRCTSQP